LEVFLTLSQTKVALQSSSSRLSNVYVAEHKSSEFDLYLGKKSFPFLGALPLQF